MAREEEELASIDELLAISTDAEDEAPAAGPRRRSTFVSRLFRSALIAVICAGAAYVVLRPLGIKVPYILLFSGFFALLAMRRALRAVSPARRLTVGAMPAAPVIGGVDPDELADGIQLAVGRWDTRLSWTERDPQRFVSAVRPRLAEMAEERLRQRRGVDPYADPRRARELMGERLWAFLYGPLTQNPNPQELAAVVDDMEKL
jgi:hypothetical protein